MKKEFIITTAAIFLFTTPVIAFANHDEGNNNGNANVHANHQNDSDQNGTSISVTPQENETDKTDDTTTNQTITPTGNCDPSADWKNHGAFVSCVAHLHQGKDEVEDAARSDIGKTANPTGSVSVTPTETVTPTVSVTPNITETPTPSISPSPTATVSPTPETSDLDVFKAPNNNLESLFSKFISFIAHLL